MLKHFKLLLIYIQCCPHVGNTIYFPFPNFASVNHQIFINMYRMSFFNAPLTNTQPSKSITAEELFLFITTDANLKAATENVRSAPDYGEAKKRLLPFVTPCGIFSRRSKDNLTELSGLIPIDIDGLATRQEAEDLRDELFADNRLEPVLCFVSPSGRGVKAFVPYVIEDHPDRPLPDVVSEIITVAMEYVAAVYGSCDTSGKDISRCCLLCHDPNAKFRDI